SWCKRLDAFIEENSEIKNMMASNFVTVKINFSPENKNEAFLSKYPKVDGYPHFFCAGERRQAATFAKYRRA
ncbi:MAG TPA: hypothetical protein VHP30_01425, partial [Ignavibacteriales bacterium]|nr:hypothetical protein [Ignavibacteriales bacterium]